MGQPFADLCAERHPHMRGAQRCLDPGTLPDGAERLLRLASAVPEKKGARRTNERPPLLQRLGAGWLGMIAGVRDTVDFLGQVALGFGRLFTGRTRLRRADLWQLLQECGAEASWIVCLISLLTGMRLLPSSVPSSWHGSAPKSSWPIWWRYRRCARWHRR